MMKLWKYDGNCFICNLNKVIINYFKYFYKFVEIDFLFLFIFPIQVAWNCKKKFIARLWELPIVIKFVRTNTLRIDFVKIIQKLIKGNKYTTHFVPGQQRELVVSWPRPFGSLLSLFSPCSNECFFFSWQNLCKSFNLKNLMLTYSKAFF